MYISEGQHERRYCWMAPINRGHPTVLSVLVELGHLAGDLGLQDLIAPPEDVDGLRPPIRIIDLHYRSCGAQFLLDEFGNVGRAITSYRLQLGYDPTERINEMAGLAVYVLFE